MRGQHYIVTASLIGWAHTQNDPSKFLGMDTANERQPYTVTAYLIGWAHTQNDPSKWFMNSIQFYTFNTMATDGLATQWAGASATMVLT